MHARSYATLLFVFLLWITIAQSLASPNSGNTIAISPLNANDTCNEEFENIANSLQPGDELILDGGIYTQSCRRAITVVGTAENPITIRAAVGENPILTRPPNRNHSYPNNNIEIIDSSYLVIKGLRFKGGNSGIRIIGGDHITFEDNDVFETGNAGITTNSSDTDAFIIRRNHIHHTGLLNSSVGTTEGEGIYLGCNRAHCIASNHLIENNHIHHLRGTSSGGNDGIEIKPGSFGNIVRNNVIHDTTIGTRFPCIFVYGAGASQNIVEGNALWNCGEAIQVVADAVIQNNIILNSDVGITTTPHTQVSQQKSVSIINNTIYGHETCLSIRWAAATDMILANNAIYCPGNEAVDAKGLNADRITIHANFIEGHILGASIDNDRFYDGDASMMVFTDPDAFNFWPLPEAILIGSADPHFVPNADFNETSRTTAPYDIGAYETFGEGINLGWQVKASLKGGLANDPAPALIPTTPPIPIPSDSDGDGIPDESDNCIESANSNQRDTDRDGFGNICDADLDDNQLVNVADFILLRNRFHSVDPHADLNGDGTVNIADYILLRNLLNTSPGPSCCGIDQ